MKSTVLILLPNHRSIRILMDELIEAITPEDLIYRDRTMLSIDTVKVDYVFASLQTNPERFRGHRFSEVIIMEKYAGQVYSNTSDLRYLVNSVLVPSLYETNGKVVFL